MNTVLRQIQIALITGEPNPTIDWFNELWSRLSIVETDVYHNDGGEFIYYIKECSQNLLIFYQDDNRNRFWCDHKNFWGIVESKFSNRLEFDVRYENIQAIIHLLINNALDYSAAIPVHPVISHLERISNVLNHVK